MNCKNCGHSVDGNYCSRCGQKSDVGRINLSYLLSEISGNIFQINHGFLYTLKELLVAPGKSVTEFLNGKRKKYFKPISYLLACSTLYFLITLTTNQNTWMDDLISGFINGALEKNTESDVTTILTWFSKNYAYATLLLLPVFSLASYLSFLKFGNNYLEHLVINSYITGQQAVFYSFIAITRVIVNSYILELILIIIVISYTFWVFWQFFKEGSRMINILRSIMTYVLYLIFSLVFLMALMRMIEL